MLKLLLILLMLLVSGAVLAEGNSLFKELLIDVEIGRHAQRLAQETACRNFQKWYYFTKPSVVPNQTAA